MEIAMKIERPRPLASKKCNDMFSAACDHCPLLKLSGHKGISVSVYLQDGLFAAPLGKRMHARHNLFFKHCPLSFDAPADKELCEMQDWCLAWCCIAHSCSRALKWGLKSLVSDNDMLESVHITISSLLRASTGIHQAVPQFIISCVVFDRPPPTNPAELEQLWTFLDIEAGKLELFLVVNPYWDGKVLHVSAALLSDPDAIGAVTTLVRYCLKWVDFSDTRWTKVGEAARLWLRSLLVGIDGIVKLTEQNDAVCRWHLAGYFKRSTSSVRVYLAVAAAAGRPSESMLFDLLQDDRFLQRADQCWQILCDELQYLFALPDSFYSTVAEAVKLSTVEYKSHCTETSLVSIAYLYQDVWLPLSCPPWKYFMGNIRENIDALILDEDVTEPVSLKMKSLARLGYDDDVVAACVLTTETSLTTVLVEQFHASGAQIMHRHPQLEHDALTCRMTVHHSRTLFYTAPFDKQEAKLLSLLEDINEQMENSSRYTGPRQVYTKILVSHAKALGARMGPSHHAIRRSAFKHHDKGFRRLSGDELSVLRRHASAMITTKLDTLSESRDHVLGQLEMLRIRRMEADNQGIVNHMTSVRFGPAEYAKFSELWFLYQSRADMGRLQPPPSSVPTAMLKVLQAEIDMLYVPARNKPDWVSTVVTYRDEFMGAGFYSDLAEHTGNVYRLLLAIGQPQRVVLLECSRCKGPDRGTSYRNYQYDGMRLVDGSCLPMLTKAHMMVVPEMNFRGMNVHAVGFPVPFNTFTCFMAQPASEGSAVNTRTRSHGPTDPQVLTLLQQEFPWLSLVELEQILGNKGGHKQGGHHGGSGSSSAGGGVDQGEADPIPEDVFAAASAELVGLKEQFGGFDEEGTLFTVRVLGGPWSIETRRVPCTDIGAYAIEKSTQLWCRAVGWPQAKSFAVRKHGGVENSRHLSEEMCRRGNSFIKAWIDAGSPSGYSFDHVKLSYRSPDSYSDWFDGLSVRSNAWKAASEMVELCPIPVPE